VFTIANAAPQTLATLLGALTFLGALAIFPVKKVK
jgi:hypothetical protein